MRFDWGLSPSPKTWKTELQCNVFGICIGSQFLCGGEWAKNTEVGCSVRQGPLFLRRPYLLAPELAIIDCPPVLFPMPYQHLSACALSLWNESRYKRYWYQEILYGSFRASASCVSRPLVTAKGMHGDWPLSIFSVCCTCHWSRTCKNC